MLPKQRLPVKRKAERLRAERISTRRLTCTASTDSVCFAPTTLSAVSVLLTDTYHSNGQPHAHVPGMQTPIGRRSVCIASIVGTACYRMVKFDFKALTELPELPPDPVGAFIDLELLRVRVAVSKQFAAQTSLFRLRENFSPFSPAGPHLMLSMVKGPPSKLAFSIARGSGTH